MISFDNKNVLFITTKNLDYLRNTQEIELIKETAKNVEVIGSYKKSYVKRLLGIYWKLLTTSTKKYDAVFVGFAPQLIIPVFGRKLKKSQLIIDFFISVYDTMAFDRKKFKPSSIPGKLCKWIDKKTIKAADRVICDTNAHGDYFAEEFEYNRENIETLYLKADKSIYHNRGLSKPDKLKDRFVVLYFGSILPLQGVEVIQEAVKKFAGDEKYYFYIIGPTKEGVKRPEADNIEYINWLSQEKLAEHIEIADLCLAGHFNADINKAKRTIPGKAYIYRAMDKPMILGDNPATHELYSETDKGIYFVKMGDADALADCIVKCSKEVGVSN